MYARDEEAAGRLTSDWRSNGFAAKLMDALYDDAIGRKLGLQTGTTGIAGEADQMRRMIAYSAVDEGTRPYGDAGIRAMFNDASDIGKALNVGDVSKTLQDSAATIAKIIAQFAGQLAFRHVQRADNPAVQVADGVLSVAPDGQTLAIDFGDQLWGAGSQGGTTPPDIIGRQDLTDKVFRTAGNLFAPGAGNDIRTGMKWLWDDDTSAIIDRIVFAAKDGALTTTLPDRSSSSPKVSLFAAGGSDDSITGSRDRDFVFGGEGNDTIRGGAGDDLLAGGKGNDSLSGGAGRDYIAGGEGQDTVFYEVTPADRLIGAARNARRRPKVRAGAARVWRVGRQKYDPQSQMRA
jgi:Ca2+-binding RTX toxin-like protein